MGEVYSFEAFQKNRQKVKLEVENANIPTDDRFDQLESNRIKLDNDLTIKSVDRVLVEGAFALYRGDDLIAIATEKPMIEELKNSVITMAQLELCDEMFPPGGT